LQAEGRELDQLGTPVVWIVLELDRALGRELIHHLLHDLTSHWPRAGELRHGGGRRG
jgi:hypothetical protein